MALLKRRRCGTRPLRASDAGDQIEADVGLIVRDIFTEYVITYKVHRHYKSEVARVELLFLSGAFESFVLKDGDSLSLNLNEARSS